MLWAGLRFLYPLSLPGPRYGICLWKQCPHIEGGTHLELSPTIGKFHQIMFFRVEDLPLGSPVQLLPKHH